MTKSKKIIIDNIIKNMEMTESFIKLKNKRIKKLLYKWKVSELETIEHYGVIDLGLAQEECEVECD